MTGHTKTTKTTSHTKTTTKTTTHTHTKTKTHTKTTSKTTTHTHTTTIPKPPLPPTDVSIELVPIGKCIEEEIVVQ